MSSSAVRGLSHLAGLVLLPLLLGGCDGFLDVENPTNLLDEDLTNPQLEQALSNSGEANFAGPYSGAVATLEMLGDQVYHVSSQDFAILIQQGDRRSNNSAAEGSYDDLAAALAVSEEVVERLQAMVSNPGSHLGIARNHFWAGAARVVLLSYFREFTVRGGPPVRPAQGLRDAIDRFQSAAQIAAAAGDANLEAGAYGAIARAYRGLYFETIHGGAGADPSLFQQAETFARQALDTDSDYSVELRYGSPGAVNGLYNTFNVGFRHRPTPQYFQRLDPVSGEPDPRFMLGPEVAKGVQGEPMHNQFKWGDFSSPLAVNRAAEARLIIAEARLVAGDLDGAVEWINRVRSNWDLPDFASSDTGEIQDQIIYERSAELWLEGRAWEDHRYYEIIPSAWSDVQKQRGVHERFPVSVREQANNPNY
ncbi:MAG: RagB/SusD family nutrient uptake outer membrane protein [Gemmatimonadota bacterium]